MANKKGIDQFLNHIKKADEDGKILPKDMRDVYSNLVSVSTMIRKTEDGETEVGHEMYDPLGEAIAEWLKDSGLIPLPFGNKSVLFSRLVLLGYTLAKQEMKPSEVVDELFKKKNIKVDDTKKEDK